MDTRIIQEQSKAYHKAEKTCNPALNHVESPIRTQLIKNTIVAPYRCAAHHPTLNRFPRYGQR